MLLTEIESFDDAIDYVVSLIGKDFEKALDLTNAILKNPSDYTGPQASIAALKLAANRYKIGIAAQVWKNKTVGGTNRTDKLIKDALMCTYDGLVEVINTLKIIARHDHELTKD